jgi:N-formylglutamate amidohydrolase
MNRYAIALISLLFCLRGQADPAPAKPKESSHPLVALESGGLPIILAAPHGGRDGVLGVPVREGKGVDRFQPKMDTNTDRLVELLTDAIEKQTGKRPFVVIARFHRRFIDANRAPEDAYESEQAKPVYDAYHQALAAARKEVIERWGSGLLLDVHGQAAAINTIFRGTRDGKTTTHLIRLHGREALTGADSLCGQLAKQGFHVAPAVGSDGKEEFYNGGHTVVTYGSGSGGTLDAIQLELGSHHRSAAQLPQTAEKMAAAVVLFAKSYLPSKEQNPKAAGEAVGDN